MNNTEIPPKADAILLSLLPPWTCAGKASEHGGDPGWIMGTEGCAERADTPQRKQVNKSALWLRIRLKKEVESPRDFSWTLHLFAGGPLPLQMPGEKAPFVALLCRRCSPVARCTFYPTALDKPSHLALHTLLSNPMQTSLHVQVLPTLQVGTVHAPAEGVSWSPCAYRHLSSISKDMLITQAREILFLFFNYVHF